jgi:hypothetical protein
MLQHMQPLARGIHSVVDSASLETVKDFSISVVLPNSVKFEQCQQCLGVSGHGEFHHAQQVVITTYHSKEPLFSSHVQPSKCSLAMSFYRHQGNLSQSMSAMGGAVEDKELSLPVTIVMGTFFIDRSAVTLVELASSFASMRSGISSSSMIKGKQRFSMPATDERKRCDCS